MLAKGESLVPSHVFVGDVYSPEHTPKFLNSQEYVGDFQSLNSLRHLLPEFPLKISVNLLLAPTVIHCSRQQQQIICI